VSEVYVVSEASSVSVNMIMAERRYCRQRTDTPDRSLASGINQFTHSEQILLAESDNFITFERNC